MIEPRRVAARAAAEFVARERGAEVGGEVGYRVRFARKGGAETRLWFLTEGVFARDLVRDPFLEDVGVVVLDEFHERHLQSDVALAVVRELQDSVRPDLRLVVMSATLATEALAAFLADAAVITSEGRAHPGRSPTTTPPRPATTVVALDGTRVAAARPRARRVERDARAPAATCSSSFPARARSGASPARWRRSRRRAGIDVCRCTATSRSTSRVARCGRAAPARRARDQRRRDRVTVEGVTIVVDSGLARIGALRRADRPRPAATRPDQPLVGDPARRSRRAARAGTLRASLVAGRGGGTARVRDARVQRVDLSRMLLELATWSLRDPTTLPWLDPPPARALARARRLLVDLGALAGDAWTPTALGRRLLAFPVAPRLARMLCEAEDLGVAAEGALVAALASERDVLRASRAFAGAAPRPAFPPGPPTSCCVRSCSPRRPGRDSRPMPASASDSMRRRSVPSTARAVSSVGRGVGPRSTRRPTSCCGPCSPAFRIACAAGARPGARAPSWWAGRG